MYGSGNGGVLLLKRASIDSGKVQVQSGFQAASFGGYRWNSKATVGFQKSQLFVSHNWQEYAGYREQEFNRKQQVSISYRQQLKPNQRITLWGTYYDGNWGLPGALNRTQADTLPQQAVPFSVLNNASLNRERWVGAITHSGNWGKHFDHFIALNVHHTKKVNPYGTSAFSSGYKDENSKSLTGRAVGRYKHEWRGFHLLAQAGAEWQVETYSIIEQSILLGEPSSFKYLYDISYRQSTVFAQTETNWKEILFFDAGVSYNENVQFVRGRNNNDFVFDTTTTWGKSILPRFSFSLQPLKGLFLYSSYSEGTANPTVFEMIDQEYNTYNTNLVSEIGTLYEIGIKHHIKSLNISYSITAYQFNITGAILPYTINKGESNEIDRYHNAGSTSQKGIEWSVKYTSEIIKNKLSITAWNNGCLNNPRFINYQVDENNLDGYRIPGVALAQVNSGLDIQFKGFSLAIQDYWLDRMPLNNTNTEWSASYHLTNIICHYHFNRNKPLQVSIHGGANNVQSTSYTSFFNLNAAVGKYYNPAPPLNFFAGFRISYTLGIR
jgi:iron complex outermembrane receptor protein